MEKKVYVARELKGYLKFLIESQGGQVVTKLCKKIDFAVCDLENEAFSQKIKNYDAQIIILTKEAMEEHLLVVRFF